MGVGCRRVWMGAGTAFGWALGGAIAWAEVVRGTPIVLDAPITAVGYAPARRDPPSAAAVLAGAQAQAHRAASELLLARVAEALPATFASDDAAKARLAWVCDHAPAEIVANPDGSAAVRMRLPVATLAALRAGPRRLSLSPTAGKPFHQDKTP